MQIITTVSSSLTLPMSEADYTVRRPTLLSQLAIAMDVPPTAIVLTSFALDSNETVVNASIVTASSTAAATMLSILRAWAAEPAPRSNGASNALSTADTVIDVASVSEPTATTAMGFGVDLPSARPPVLPLLSPTVPSPLSPPPSAPPLPTTQPALVASVTEAQSANDQSATPQLVNFSGYLVVTTIILGVIVVICVLTSFYFMGAGRLQLRRKKNTPPQYPSADDSSTAGPETIDIDVSEVS